VTQQLKPASVEYRSKQLADAATGVVSTTHSYYDVHTNLTHSRLEYDRLNEAAWLKEVLATIRYELHIYGSTDTYFDDVVPREIPMYSSAAAAKRRAARILKQRELIPEYLQTRR
jgi:hypothetical protein